VKSKNVLKTLEEIKTNKSEEKDEKTTTNLLIREISLDQSPLELAADRTGSESDSNNENKLKLIECERNLEINNLIRNFKLLIDDLILSSSPFITYQMPFLLVDSDVLCKYLQNSHKKYLNSDILLRDSTSASSSHKSPTIAYNENSSNTSIQTIAQDDGNLHEFLLLHFSKSFDDSQLKRLYADYKSRGGIASSIYRNRILIDETEKFSPEKKPYVTNDCLDVFNRQHLAVLFCSQCENSPVYPNMCHMPKIINLRFYGENDMTFGMLTLY
jgi:hypothetical protein